MNPISRRAFLAGSVVVVVAACSGSDPVGEPGTTVPTGDTEPTGGDAAELLPAPPADLTADPFTLGVASGDPSDSVVVLWTRLAPDALSGGGMPDTDVEVVWDLASDEAFTELITSQTTTASAQYGHSVHVTAEVPQGWSYYRFRVGDFTSPVGRTRPAPAKGDSEQVRFVTASCQNYEAGFYTAHRDIADQKPDFVAFLGDYIYEGAAREVGGGVVRSHDGPEPTDIAAYRNRYALYKGDADLQAAHAACPWFVIWDDHEVENNYAGLIPQDPADAAVFAERRRQAYQAWWEHQPVALDPPEGDDFTIYRRASWGSLLDISLLDGRQYRTDQGCGDATLNLDPACPDAFEETRTMLGADQEAWLIDGLSKDTAAWSVVAQQTVFGNVMLGDAVLNYDQWDGYQASRNRVVDSLDPSRNTVVLTGDIHFAGVGFVRQGERGTGTPVAAEFVATSISSSGNVDASLQSLVTSIPDIVDVELAHRGYILHTVDAATWSADYRIVDDATVEGGTVSSYATYRLDAGSNVPVKV
jgi:alkaline phosphatase D